MLLHSTIRPSSRYHAPQPILRRMVEEKVCDERDQRSPEEHIQRKLQLAMPGRQLPISSMHLERLVRR
jgi:hypothetical protein